MMSKHYFQNLTHITLGACLLLCQTSLRAEEVVRMNMESNGVAYSVDITLFDEINPITVTNFLTYLTDGDYTNSFIHRNAVNFVLQGGGFTYDATVGDGLFTNDIFTGGLRAVPTDPPIVNEYKKTNATGTIAMALVGNNPDSATSQWFVNMDENSLTLDAQSGPFTVFGKVLANGMDTFNLLSNIPPVNATPVHPAFTDLPLNNINALNTTDEITDANLIMVRDIVQLYRVDTRVDFGAPVLATPVNRVFSITNNNVTAITIDTIDTSSIAPEFTSIDVSACSNTTLAVNQSCDMNATLTPSSTNPHSSNINVSVSNLGHSFVINLTTPAPNIDSAFTTIDFGLQQLLDTQQIILFINNIGEQDLTITSVSAAGATPSDFSFTDNCTLRSPVVAADFCVLPINFTPTTLGVINAEIRIDSDDPDTPALIIPLTGISSLDTDGISEVIEDSAPNAGDGNNDEVLDSTQNNITSFVDSSNSYITLLARDDLNFDNVALIDPATLPTPPANTNFKNGAFEFELKNVSQGLTADIGLILPLNTSAKDLFLYGPSLDDINPHWYSLQNALNIFIIANNGTLTPPSGNNKIQRNFITFTVVDGGNGDADGFANGAILFRGSVDVGVPASNGDSGGVISILLLALGLLPVYLRRKQRRLCDV